MLRPLPLWPTLFGVNLWLVALLVPLLLGRAAASTFAWAAVPLGLLSLVAGLLFRRHRPAQILLIIGLPLVVLLPTAEGPLASAKLHPPLAVAVQLAVLLAYLSAVCSELSRDPRPAAAGWSVTPVEPPALLNVPQRVRRRILTYRLLFGMCIAVPLLFLYAINWHPENVAALRAALGTPARAAAMQASLTAVFTTVWSVLFHFCCMGPIGAHLDHDRRLRRRLTALREAARRGRPRPHLYAAIVVALLSMGVLLWWSI
jgi:hypothetical protein